MLIQFLKILFENVMTYLCEFNRNKSNKIIFLYGLYRSFFRTIKKNTITIRYKKTLFIFKQSILFSISVSRQTISHHE